MKKLFIIIILLVAGQATRAQALKGEERKTVKAEFVKSCISSGTEGTTDKGMIKAMNTYCECAGEKVVNKFTKKEIESFNTMTEAQIEKTLMPVIDACLQQLQKDVAAMQK
jgi:hypothetical protein